MMAILSCSIVRLFSSCQMKSASFHMRLTRGLAIEEKSLIQIHIVPVVLHGSQVQTLATFESSGLCPSYVHLWFKTMTSGTAMKTFLAERSLCWHVPINAWLDGHHWGVPIWNGKCQCCWVQFHIPHLGSHSVKVGPWPLYRLGMA